MKNYYIDKVNVIVNGTESIIETVSGCGYDLNIVKAKAIQRVEKRFPNSDKFAAVLISHEEYTYEEYKNITGSNPSWLIGEN